MPENNQIIGALENLLGAFLVLDGKSHRCVHCNQQFIELTGIKSQPETLSEVFRNRLHLGDCDRAVQWSHSVTEVSASLPSPLVVRWSGPGVVSKWYRFSCADWSVVPDSPLRIILLEDISALKRAEEERSQIMEFAVHLGRLSSLPEISRLVLRTCLRDGALTFGAIHSLDSSTGNFQLLEQLCLERQASAPPEMLAATMAGEVLNGLGDVGFIPTEKSRELLQDWKKRGLVQSIGCCPLQQGDELLGFLTVAGPQPHIPAETRSRIQFYAQGLTECLHRLQTRDHLREQKTLFESFMDKLPATAFIKDHKGHLTYMNEYMQTLFGDSSRLGRKVSEYYPKAQADLATEQDRLALTRGQSIAEERVVVKSGAERLFRTHKFRINRENATPLLGGISVDVTDIRRAERLAKQSEERYRLLTDYATDMISRVSSEGVFLYVSPASRSLLGYAPGELLGRYLHEFIHPDDRRRQPVFSDRPKDPDQIQRQEFRLVCRDKSTVWVENTMRSTKGFETGSQIEFINVTRDISQRRETEAALLRRDAILESVSYAAECFLRSTDWFDQAPEVLQNLGYSVGVGYVVPLECQDCVGQPTYQPTHQWSSPTLSNWQAWDELVVLPEWSAAWQQGESLWANRISAEPEVRAWMADHNLLTFAAVPVVVGSDFWGIMLLADSEFEHNWTIAEIDAFKAATNILGTAIQRKHEDEDRRRLEEQMRQVQKLESLGILAGGVAHDFNNLLQAILGHATLGMLDVEPESPVYESLSEIEKASNQAAELTQKMLAYSGHGHFILDHVNLGDMVLDLLDLVRASISKKIDLVTDIQENLPLIEGDVSQLRQVVINIVINASESCEDQEGTVTIRVKAHEPNPEERRLAGVGDPLPPGECVMLEVCDTGSGMDTVTQERLFDPFFTTKFTGRGLGLAAVQGIVRGHHGGIHVESSLGSGTAFRVYFPVISTAQPQETTEEPPHSALKHTQNMKSSGKPSSGKKILVVDDDETVRTLAGQILTKEGFEVSEAVDGREALRFMGQGNHPVDLILLDMMMPHLGGDDVLGVLKSDFPDIPVVLSSGYAREDLEEDYPLKSIVGFLQKPYRSKDLLETVSGILHPDTD